MTLERASFIIGIAGVAFTIFWGVWTYNRPPETAEGMPAPQLTIAGSQNFLTQGNNNVVGGQLDGSMRKADDFEARLGKLTTGVSRSFIEMNFGAATFEDAIPGLNLNNLIFVFPRFFLQIITSLEGKAVFYSVTSRTSEFRPTIPKLGGKLLETKFLEIGSPEKVTSAMSSKDYVYTEKFYLGNSGNYRNFYVGYCSAGASPDWERFAPVTPDRDGSTAHKQFRAINSPNCFGVGDILGDEDKLLESVGMGIGYSIARDLPEG